ncbi:MAG: hypothetical protein DCC68_24345 [Planctomycetota bacterium]|nr:MAG: hypothetical protein DCC68_24345 [Planctomycetota bacterium]
MLPISTSIDLIVPLPNVAQRNGLRTIVSTTFRLFKWLFVGGEDVRVIAGQRAEQLRSDREAFVLPHSLDIPC